MTTFSRITPTDAAIARHIGRRVRQRRKLLGMSMTTLADELGVCFQCVQKWETQVNRMPAAKLHMIARKLECGVDYFFQGL